MLGYANLALNQRKLSSGYTPQMLALGQNSQTTALLREDEDFNSHEEFSEFMTKRLDKIYEQHNMEREKRGNKNREHMNNSRKEKSFKVNQLVTLKNNEIGQGEGGSLKNRNLGIYQIISINERERCCILKHLGNGKERGAHLMHIKELEDNDNKEPTPIRNEALRLTASSTVDTNQDLIAPRNTYNLRPRS